MSWRDWRSGVEGSRRVGSDGRREMMPGGSDGGVGCGV